MPKLATYNTRKLFALKSNRLVYGAAEYTRIKHNSCDSVLMTDVYVPCYIADCSVYINYYHKNYRRLI